MGDYVVVLAFNDVDESDLRAIESQLWNIELPPDEVLTCTPEQERGVRRALDW